MTNATNTTANATRGRGRPAKFENKKQIAAELKKIGTENAPSRYLTMQLVDAGYVEKQPVNTGKKGRPAHNYVVAGKGRSLMALAQRWK